MPKTPHPGKTRGGPAPARGKPAPGAVSQPRDRLFRIAGLPAVKAVFAKDPGRVERLFFDDRLKADLGDACAFLARNRRPYRLVTADELEKIAGSAMHGGVVAVAAPRPVLPFDPAEAADWARAGEPLLLLDGVGNPHNLGAIVRTAAFFGLSRIVLSDHPGQALPSEAAYRVAEGGFEHVTLYRAEGFARQLRRLGEVYRTVGTALGGAHPLADFAAGPRPVAVVLGNEEHGLSEATLRACADIATIPGSGWVQSLNVSATAAIVLHEMLRGSPR